MFVYLGCDPYWYKRVRDEVDAAVEKHRQSPEQTPLDVLSSLDIEAWESDFPLIELCLRECIRFQLVGTAFRKNISGKDVPIGNDGEVVPKDAFAVSRFCLGGWEFYNTPSFAHVRFAGLPPRRHSFQPGGLHGSQQVGSRSIPPRPGRGQEGAALVSGLGSWPSSLL